MAFEQVCNFAAARRCYEAGQSVAEIAKSAKKSETTIYRWLWLAGAQLRRKPK